MQFTPHSLHMCCHFHQYLQSASNLDTNIIKTWSLQSIIMVDSGRHFCNHDVPLNANYSHCLRLWIPILSYHFLSYLQVRDYINNQEKCNSYKGGQWSAIDKLVKTDAKEQGLVLLYQTDNRNAPKDAADRCWVLSLANSASLKAARSNQPIIGIDAKHGLQDDGCILHSSVTMHKEGFGCPTAFSLMSKENAESIRLALRAIIENVPCQNSSCTHPYEYYNLPQQKGYRKVSFVSF